jgi:hypothetical protein
MPKPLKLVHLANFNSTNIGNGALISGLETVFQEDFPGGVEWTREPWDDYSFGLQGFDERVVGQVNSHDGLIVNGAVAIHGRDYLRETGMRFELPLAMIAEVKKPIVFYGISYRHFKGQAFHHQETLRKTIAAYAENPNIFLGVRNDGTKKWLKETLLVPGSVLQNVHEVPDTGVFVQARGGLYPEILPGRKVVIFSPNDEDAQFRYGELNVRHARETGYRLRGEAAAAHESAWIRNRARLIEAIKNALTEVLRETGAQLLLVPHYFDDLKFISALVDAFKPQVAHQTSITTGLMRLPGTAFFYGRYQKADLAVSMRVHSMSPCIGMGVPMVPLVTQPRMWDFLSAVGLSDLAVDAFAADLEAQLPLLCLRTLADPAESLQRYSIAAHAMRKEARRINSRLLDLFKE